MPEYPINQQAVLDYCFDESQLEDMFVNMLHAELFTRCVQKLNIPSSIEVSSSAENTETITDSDISKYFENFLWSKFGNDGIRSVKVPQRLEILKPHRPICFVAYLQRYSSEYYEFLMTPFSKRYGWIKYDEDKAWIRQIIRLAVAYHILEYKHDALQSGNLKAFVSPYAKQRMIALMERRKTLQAYMEASNEPWHDMRVSLDEDRKIVRRSFASVPDVIAALNRMEHAYLLCAKKHQDIAIQGFEQCIDVINARPLVEQQSIDAQQQALRMIGGGN